MNLAKKHTTGPLGWSRDADGSLHPESAFDWLVFYGSVMAEEPTACRIADRLGIVIENGMDWQDAADKNGIVFNWNRDPLPKVRFVDHYTIAGTFVKVAS